MKPLIRAAVDSGRPPLELILDHPDRKRCKWDGILIKALYMLESYELEGWPLWIEESTSIRFESRHRDVRSAAVVEAAQKTESKKDNPTAGRRFYAVPKLIPGHKWPTRREWLEGKRRGEATPGDEVADIKRAEEAEARAAAKAAANPDVDAIVAEFERRFNSRNGRMDQNP